MICVAKVASDTHETLFPDSQLLSLFRVAKPKRSTGGYQFQYILKVGNFI